jgi:hypothetical protein
VTNGSLGGGVARKVGGAVAEASVITRRKLMPAQHDLALKVQDSFFRLMGGEIRATMGPLFVALADSPEAPDWARRTFDFLGRGHGQWQAFLASSAGGSAMSAGLIPLLNNELAPVTQNLIAQNPNFVLDLGSAAALVGRNLAPLGAMDAEARRQGLSSGRFQRMVRLAQHGLAPGEVLDAVNRGRISGAEAASYLRDAGYTDQAIPDVLALRHALISAQEAAVMENFGAISRAEGHRYAAAVGMAADDYDNLAFSAGQPPPLDVLYRGRRTGAIDGARFRKGIQQGPIRVEWFDLIDKLLFLPAPPEQALAAATQNLLPANQARAIWREYGYRDDDFGWALESNGRPLGIEQAAELYNRGEITHGEARQMFLESNVKNKYVDLIFPLFERLPTMEMTVRMVRGGALTRAQGVRNLRQLGFDVANATALMDLATRDKTEETRALTVGTVQELYEDRAITRKQALDALAALGYETDEAELILSIRDLRYERRVQQAAVSRVHARYVGHRIDDREAQNALDSLGVNAAERADLIDTWQVERDVSVPQLSTSQVQQALRRGLIDAGGARTRLLQAGYSDEDAAILVALATPA